ncbi:MAG TPA: hypothetical protein VM165_20330 [Planctomycetaceae bacterium]|nr:hypothetical protein [Planctomycetaceae bacterium]
MADRNARHNAETVELSREEMAHVQGGFQLTSSPAPQAILIGLLLPAVQK